jgi:hypothetical protein
VKNPFVNGMKWTIGESDIIANGLSPYGAHGWLKISKLLGTSRENIREHVWKVLDSHTPAVTSRQDHPLASSSDPTHDAHPTSENPSSTLAESAPVSLSSRGPNEVAPVPPTTDSHDVHPTGQNRSSTLAESAPDLPTSENRSSTLAESAPDLRGPNEVAPVPPTTDSHDAHPTSDTKRSYTRWNAADIAKFHECIRVHGWGNWASIVRDFLNNVKTTRNLIHYADMLKEKCPDEFLRLSQQHPDPRHWTEVERARFEESVRVVGWGKWKLVAKNFIPTKTKDQVKNYAGRIKRQGLMHAMVNGELPATVVNTSAYVAALDVAHGINDEAVRNAVHDNSEVVASLPPLPVITDGTMDDYHVDEIVAV